MTRGPTRRTVLRSWPTRISGFGRGAVIGADREFATLVFTADRDSAARERSRPVDAPIVDSGRYVRPCPKQMRVAPSVFRCSVLQGILRRRKSQHIFVTTAGTI